MAAPIIPMSEFAYYLRRPSFQSGRERLNLAAIRHILQLLLFTLLAVVVLSGLIGGILSSLLGDIPANENNLLGQADPIMFLLTGVILAPVLEELMFRSWLGGPRASIIGLPVLASVALLLATGTADMDREVTMGISAFFAVLIVLISRRYVQQDEAAQGWARARLFPLAFYGSALLFGLMHLANYEGGLSSPVMLLAVLPQGLVGLVLGYVRMRFGLFVAIGFHAAYNAVLIALFLVSQSIEPAVDAGTTAMMSALWPLALVAGSLPA